jgi:3-carboxy-cis,cis-muconate cycloisomerase
MMRNDGLFRDLFSTQRMRAIWSDDAGIAAWLRVEQAIAAAQADLGLIDSGTAQILLKITPDRIDRARLAEDALLVGRPIVGLVNQLRELVGPEAAVHIHRGVTTFDLMDSAMALHARDSLIEVDEGIGAILSRIEMLNESYGNLEMMGRSNHQHAVPMRFGTKLTSWSEELKRRRTALTQAAEAGIMVQFGGPVGELADWPVETATTLRANLAARLGLGAPTSHWQNARDGLAQIVLAAGLLGATLSRIGRNVNLLSGTETGELREEHRAGQGASSAMAHKRNQRASEFTEGLGRSARQSSERIGETMLHDHERSGGALIAEWPVMPETFLYLSGALMWGARMFDRLIVDPTRMAEKLSSRN